MSTLMDLIDGLGYALDTPGAYTRGLLAGRPGERVDGRDMLQEWGVLGENQEGLDGGDVAGFFAEMLLDPLNAVGGGALKAVTGANKGIRAANTSSKAMRAAGAMPEEIAKLTKIADDAGPKRMYHGTSHVFDQPDPSKFDPNALYGPGHYATDNPRIASEYPDKEFGKIDSARRTAEEDIEFLNRRLPKLKEMELAGLPDDYPIRHGVTRAEKIAELEQRLLRQMEAAQNVPRPNVRMNYMDARNPFDMDAEIPIAELERISRANGGTPDYSQLAPTGTASGDFMARKFWGTEDLPNRLKAAGYDAITHRGGGRMGDEAHNVAIAFDPSQLYSPYIAPALQNEKRTAPYLAALFGYNAAQAPYDIRQ